MEVAMPAGLEINGRVALVTGANRGIGLALVNALLERGARRIYAATRKPEALAEQVVRSENVVVPLRLDVTRSHEVQEAAERAGDVDLLINNAAMVGYMFGGFENPIWLDVAREEYETNVLGALRISQAFAPVLARQGGGTIVNVGSIAGLVGMPLVLTYSTTKAGLHSLTQSTRQMLQGQGTWVVGVYPGPVDTDMAAQVTLPKASAASVANAILDGLEQGVEEIYPDPFAREYGEAYARNPKSLEGRMAGVNVAMD
jgi:NAD(P)-dependent dehydrogenase (short-subunit alcohol dehydrogenase family)